MKKIGFILMLFLIIPIAAIAKDEDANELEAMAAFVADNDLTIESWEVTIKEKVKQDQLQDIIENLKDSHLVSTTEDENAIKYKLRSTHKNADVSVIYSVVIPKDPKFETELTAVIKGDNWSESILDIYQEKFNFIMKQYFTDSSKRFACLTTENNAIINSDHFFNETIDKFNLKFVSTQTDKINKVTNKKILYGYTPLWNQKLTIMDKPVNIQIAIKSTEKRNSKITLGTPILINEY